MAVPAVYLRIDALIQSFILGWDWTSFFRHPIELFNAPIFHPERLTLTYMDHLAGEALFAAPVFYLTGRHAAGYNMALFASFVFSGWAVYRLCRYLGASRAGSCVAGFLFAFAPYRFSNLGELNLLQTQFLPLILLCALRFADRRRVQDLYLLVASLALQVWNGWYYTIYAALALLFLLVLPEVRSIGKWIANRLVATAGALLVLLLITFPFVYPYWLEQQRLKGFARSLEAIPGSWCAHPLDYLRMNGNNWLAGVLHGMSGAHGYSPGPLAVALAFVAALGFLGTKKSKPGPGILRQRQVMGYFVILAAFGAVLSLGPVLSFQGRSTGIPLPYEAFHRFFPGFGVMRVPGRFALLVTLGAVVLSAFGYDWIRRPLGPSGGAVLLSGSLALATILSLQARIPFQALPRQGDMPPVYSWLASQPERSAIVELPMPATEIDEKDIDATRQFYVLFHHKKRLDGVSGFLSPEYASYRQVMQSFPDAASIAATRERGADFLICHYGDLDEPARTSLKAKVEAAPGLTQAAAFGDDVVYRLPAR